MLTLPGFLLLLTVHRDVLSAFEWQANEVVSQQNYPKGMRKELKHRHLGMPALGTELHHCHCMINSAYHWTHEEFTEFGTGLNEPPIPLGNVEITCNFQCHFVGIRHTHKIVNWCFETCYVGFEQLYFNNFLVLFLQDICSITGFAFCLLPFPGVTALKGHDGYLKLEGAEVGQFY